ncbi:2802_t:CDS:2, partial [Dentiscutata erythropus]
MDAGGVQVQHQPSSQDPTRQSWRNNNSNGDQGKRRDSGSNKSKPVNLRSINVESAQSVSNTSRTAGSNNNSGVQPLRTPKTAQFPKPNQQVYAMQPTKTATLVKTAPQQQPHMTNMPTRSSPPQTVFVSRSSPPPQNNVPATAPAPKQKTASSSRPTPKPLNLSKSSHVSNLSRVPQTATFPPKVNRALNLPNPPKTATFATKSSGFPKDTRQSMRAPQSATLPQSAYAFVYGDPTYVQTVEPSRFRRYSSTPAPLRFVTADYRQVQLGPGTPVVVLSHPDDSDSQGSSPPTPGYGPPEGFTSADYYDLCTMPPCEEEQEEGQSYYYYDYSQEYIPHTPTGTLQNHRSNSLPATAKDERRRSVFGGPMRMHSDAVLPIRQPKGPDIAKNFATRIRRKAVNKLYAAAAERRSKSAADRRKSA